MKDKLRKELLAKRKKISTQTQLEKSKALANHFKNNPFFTTSQDLAFYWPSGGEISPLPLIEIALKENKNCYLPSLDKREKRCLCFTLFSSEDDLIASKLGILEPVVNYNNLKPPKSLDLVIAPLVAFDKNCYRLGRGGGYYDKTFAGENLTPITNIIGFAYDMQEISKVPTDPWDLQLTGIATETKFIQTNFVSRFR